MKEYPEKTKSDKAIELAHAGGQLIPSGIGSAISSFLNSFFPHGFEKRKEEWFKSLGDYLKGLPEKQIDDLKNYIGTEEGKTLFLQATLSAIQTHKKEKLITIRNVLFNTVIDSNIHYDQKEIYLSIAMSLETYDLILLQIIIKNIDKFAEVDSYKKAFLIAQKLGFQGNEDEFLLILNKLKERSLIRISEYIGGFGDVYAVVTRITESNSNENKPKFKVTRLATNLINFINKNA